MKAATKKLIQNGLLCAVVGICLFVFVMGIIAAYHISEIDSTPAPAIKSEIINHTSEITRVDSAAWIMKLQRQLKSASYDRDKYAIDAIKWYGVEKDREMEKVREGRRNSLKIDSIVYY